MREENSNWFPNWEDQLPSPNELISLSQTLIPPNLATAFNIQSGGYNGGATSHHHPTPPPFPPLHHPNSSEFDSSSTELGGGGGGGGACSSEEPARTMKRPRLVWTPQLHKRFVDAVAQLGIKNAVPKTIMQLMSVDGLTRENVASHLQKYRLYLKRMQSLSGPGCGPDGGLGGSGDPIADRLFASSPVPPHFLQQIGGPGGGGNGPEHLVPYVTGLAHGQPMAGHHQIQAQYQYHHMQMGRVGLGPDDGQFEYPFLSRQAHLGPVTNGIMVHNNNNSGFVEDLESATINNGRKVLTLFPTKDD